MKRCVNCKAICDNKDAICSKCGSNEFEPFIVTNNGVSLQSKDGETYVQKYDKLVNVLCIIAGIISTAGVIVAAIVLEKYWIIVFSVLCPILAYLMFIALKARSETMLNIEKISKDTSKIKE